jgi:hypothetical protein
MLLVLDHNFEQLLAPSNFLYAGWDDDPIVQDLRIDNPDLASLIELEWDSGFFPPEMAPEAGDETLAVGRWVFDCGHEGAEKNAPLVSTGFRTEIHAPEIIVSSHVLQTTALEVHVQFKIFTGSRSGPLDTVPLFFFVERFFSSHKNPLGGQDYSVMLEAPGSGWKIASCRVSDGTPAGGRPHRIKGTVRPDDDGKSLTWSLTAGSFKNSARIESSQLIDVRWVREDFSSGGGLRQCQ